MIAVPVWCTADNDRDWMLRAVLKSLAATVDWSRHDLFLVDNNSHAPTHALYAEARAWLPFELIALPENVGTARAVNHAWLRRKPGQACVKLDSDVVVNTPGWADVLEDAAARDERIGVCGAKRKDCAEAPWRAEEWWRSELVMLPHEPGRRWLVAERVLHVMGSCQLYPDRWLRRCGYLYQMGGLYACDDCLAAVRTIKAGMYSCFVHGIDIDHVDPGTTGYQAWKEAYAARVFPRYDEVREQYLSGARDVYQGPFDE